VIEEKICVADSSLVVVTGLSYFETNNCINGNKCISLQRCCQVVREVGEVLCYTKYMHDLTCSCVIEIYFMS